MARKNTRKQIFTNVEVIDAAAKGKTVAKAPDGRVIFLLQNVNILVFVVVVSGKIWVMSTNYFTNKRKLPIT